MENLWGRSITKEEWDGDHSLLESVEVIRAVEKTATGFRCNRCGNKGSFAKTPCACGSSCVFCTQCIQMGKMKSCTKLYLGKQTNQKRTLYPNPLAWSGTLSSEQKRASKAIVIAVEEKQTHVLWAVTGAGKTEMLFQGIAQSLRKGERAAIASPRIDVVLELAPRIRTAFPLIPFCVLYGEAEEPYVYTPLVLSTTHQLLRFKRAFDLLIIDEVDAFPYPDDPMLLYATETAGKEQATHIYVTATPTRTMQQAILKESLAVTKLPCRYHGYPLPVPSFQYVGSWEKAVTSRSIRSRFYRKVVHELRANRRTILFVSRIKGMIHLEEWLNEQFPTKRIVSVSASDEERKEKVQMMRRGEVDWLLSTTILERGVTFRDIDVIVIGADDAIFTESALVQMAGRVGRDASFATGSVVFFHAGVSQAMKRARKQIRLMNDDAKERGLLHDLSTL